MDYCRFVLQRKAELTAYAIDELRISMQSETKSSVGDKHETARARMQFEEEKLAEQLAEMKKQFKELERMDGSVMSDRIGSGSLVETDKGRFFISVSLGRIELEGTQVYAVSPASPLAHAMKGLQAKDKFTINQVNYHVISVS